MIIVSLRGYPYAMPDMIGGNQYDGDKADKELLIRWAQASALMPLIQFSIVPWHFDEETQKLRLLKDINPGSADSYPSDYTFLSGAFHSGKPLAAARVQIDGQYRSRASFGFAAASSRTFEERAFGRVA